MLGCAMPASWLSRLSNGQKLALSFGLIVIVLIGSFSALPRRISSDTACPSLSARARAYALATANASSSMVMVVRIFDALIYK